MVKKAGADTTPSDLTNVYGPYANVNGGPQWTYFTPGPHGELVAPGGEIELNLGFYKGRIAGSRFLWGIEAGVGYEGSSVDYTDKTTPNTEVTGTDGNCHAGGSAAGCTDSEVDDGASAGNTFRDTAYYTDPYGRLALNLGVQASKFLTFELEGALRAKSYLIGSTTPSSSGHGQYSLDGRLFKNLDAGLQVGAGLMIARNVELNLGANYQFAGNSVVRVDGADPEIETNYVDSPMRMLRFNGGVTFYPWGDSEGLIGSGKADKTDKPEKARNANPETRMTVSNENIQKELDKIASAKGTTKEKLLASCHITYIGILKPGEQYRLSVTYIMEKPAKAEKTYEVGLYDKPEASYKDVTIALLDRIKCMAEGNTCE